MAQPKIALDSFLQRPLVLLIHGGSFTHGSRNDMVSEAMYFAGRGYVSASIDYRMGWSTGASSNPASCLGNNTSHKYALYRTVQDAKAALRFIVSNASIFNVDTSAIFIGGTSSGAFTSMSVCYMSEADFEIVAPGIVATLGGLDTASNDLHCPVNIKGLLAYKDAIFDSTFIQPNEFIPTLFIHGTADPYYPYLTGTVYTCPSYFTTQGAGLIAPYMARNGGCYENNYKVNGDHGLIYPQSYTLAVRSHFVKQVLCGECHQTIVENQITISDSLLASSVSSYSNVATGYHLLVNPVRHEISVERDGNILQNGLSLDIYNLLGQIVLSTSIEDVPSIISLNTLNNGIYICELRAQGTKLLATKVAIY